MEISLKDLAKNTKWVFVEPRSSGRKKTQSHEIRVSYFRKTKKSNNIDLVTITFGQEVLKKLKWKMNDKIEVFYHPDDIFSYMLIKSQSERGYNLIKNGAPTNSTLIIRFAWNNPLVLQGRKSSPVEYIHNERNNSIVFRAADGNG